MVAPYVGAWIETWTEASHHADILSHPTWVRGLKLPEVLKEEGLTQRRTLRGCVD